MNTRQIMAVVCTAFLSFFVLIPEFYASNTDATSADVIVYGSTPGGFCAAIAAAREGASVMLLEPTDHIGAMNTGGLSHCDSNQMVRSTLLGLFEEWHMRIVKDYNDRGLKAPYNPA
ncbi:MAG: FAD-dependent oxidoreductase, partial [Pirellulales bacterium]